MELKDTIVITSKKIYSKMMKNNGAGVLLQF